MARLTLEEAEARTGIKTANLRRVILSGKLRASKESETPRGKYYVEESDLAAYVAGITRGRPRATKRDTRLPCWLTEGEIAEIRAAAEASGVTLSEFVYRRCSGGRLISV